MPTLEEKRAARRKRDREKKEKVAAWRARRASKSKNPEMRQQNKIGEAKHSTYGDGRIENDHDLDFAAIVKSFKRGAPRRRRP